MAMRELEDLLAEAGRRPLVGWDLSYDGRIGFAPPWDFEALADARIRAAPDLLDMGTGGGEWLSRRPFPKRRTLATEGWAPNVPVAQARLAPLGACVVAVEGAPDNVDQAVVSRLPSLPFADAAFHLVANRHESFVAAEVARVLRPGGCFLTQQIRGDFDAPLRRLLGLAPRPPGPAWDLQAAAMQVRAAGMQVTESGEGEARISFADVGALAWYLMSVPWALPGVDPGDWRARLAALHGHGALSVRQPMFWLEARKA
jgi:SAM-dependent methyltransferase